MLEEPPAQLQQRSKHRQVPPLLQAIRQPVENKNVENKNFFKKVKPVEESHQFVPFAELRVLVGSWVENHLKTIIKELKRRVGFLHLFRLVDNSGK